MKKYILILSAFFLAACGSSSSFTNLSLPNFKPQVQTQVQNANSGVSIEFASINMEQNNNYSDFFENSVLKLRIEREIELLKQNLEEQIETIVKLKGYELKDSNADYKLNGLVSIYIEEKDVQKNSSFMSGDFVKSNLGINFKAKIELVDAENSQNSTQISSDTKLDSLVELNYPIKNDDGLSMFKTTISNVPTELSKELAKPAFEIDKSFLAFYKNTLNSLYNNMPLAEKKEEKSSFNSFEENTNFENIEPKIEPKQENTTEFLDKSEEKDLGGIEIFE